MTGLVGLTELDVNVILTVVIVLELEVVEVLAKELVVDLIDGVTLEVALEPLVGAK